MAIDPNACGDRRCHDEDGMNPIPSHEDTLPHFPLPRKWSALHSNAAGRKEDQDAALLAVLEKWAARPPAPEWTPSRLRKSPDSSRFSEGSSSSGSAKPGGAQAFRTLA